MGGHDFAIPSEGEEIFKAGLWCSLADDRDMFFWSDRWLDGLGMEQLSSDLLKFVTPRHLCVVEALNDDLWVRDIGDAPSISAIT